MSGLWSSHKKEIQELVWKFSVNRFLWKVSKLILISIISNNNSFMVLVPNILKIYTNILKIYTNVFFTIFMIVNRFLCRISKVIQISIIFYGLGPIAPGIGYIWYESVPITILLQRHHRLCNHNLIVCFFCSKYWHFLYWYPHTHTLFFPVYIWYDTKLP